MSVVRRALRRLPLVLLGLTMGCVTWPAVESDVQDEVAKKAARRYSFETGCPETEIRARYFSDVELGVEGCGMRAVYLLTGDFGPGCWFPGSYWDPRARVIADTVDSCTLILNSESRPQVQVQPPPQVQPQVQPRPRSNGEVESVSPFDQE